MGGRPSVGVCFCFMDSASLSLARWLVERGNRLRFHRFPIGVILTLHYGIPLPLVRHNAKFGRYAIRALLVRAFPVGRHHPACALYLHYAQHPVVAAIASLQTGRDMYHLPPFLALCLVRVAPHVLDLHSGCLASWSLKVNSRCPLA